MSTGLPQLLGATGQPSFSSPFPHFGYFFGQQTNQPFALHQSAQSSAQNSRFKTKRHRQRVDAGEPRNAYQGGKSVRSDYGMMQIESLNGMWNNTNPSPDLMRTNDEPTDLTFRNENDVDDLDVQLDVETSMETKEEDVESEITSESVEKGETPTIESRESPSSTSSASKRKSFLPQKIREQLGMDFSEEPEQVNVSVGGIDTDRHDDVVSDVLDEKPSGSIEMSALQAQLASSSSTAAKIQSDVFEAQKRLYTAFIEQQRKMIAQQQQEEEKKLNYEQLVRTLKSEIFDNLTASIEKVTPLIEKVVKDWAVAELARQEMLTAPASNPPAPPPFHPIFSMPSHNPLGFPMQNAHAMNGGIFPPNFNAFNPLQAFNVLRRNLEEEGPKKKRAKMFEIKREESSSVRPSSPLTAPSSPRMGNVTPNLSRYFPPTMVGHPLYGGMSFGEREDSPTNSEEMGDCGPYDGSGHNATLTPMHLRKAKLMFFFTRYPNSNLLKSYFPDIRFNKNNTAQLVKWFSNFREFYYIQMEKFARQLLAEGVKTRQEIFVSKDSELFKALNTHYNRNNHIQAPDKLVLVVQESLREFFDAVRLGKDTEPSWKKTIYKVINRMDDAIPDYFKDPNFLDRLES